MFQNFSARLVCKRLVYFAVLASSTGLGVGLASEGQAAIAHRVAAHPEEPTSYLLNAAAPLLARRDDAEALRAEAVDEWSDFASQDAVMSDFRDNPGMAAEGFGYEEPADSDITAAPETVTLELPASTHEGQDFILSVHVELPIDCDSVRVHRETEGRYTHYLDFEVIQTRGECSSTSTVKTLQVNFGKLPAGLHTISTFSPDGTEFRTMFHILPKRS